MPTIRHPRRKAVILTLVIGFWSQVFLWRGLIHGGDELSESALSPSCPGPRPAPLPTPPDAYTPGIENAVRAAMPAINAAASDLASPALIGVYVAVTAEGRVRWVKINPESCDVLSPATRRGIENVLKKTLFPPREHGYARSIVLNLTGPGR